MPFLKFCGLMISRHKYALLFSLLVCAFALLVALSGGASFLATHQTLLANVSQFNARHNVLFLCLHLTFFIALYFILNLWMDQKCAELDVEVRQAVKHLVWVFLGVLFVTLITGRL